MYIWGDVCLSLYFHHSMQLSFFFSFSFLPNLLPLYFSLSCPLSWCSLTLIVVVLVPFFKPSKSVSYQTPITLTIRGLIQGCWPANATHHLVLVNLHRQTGLRSARWSEPNSVPLAPVFQTARLGFHPQLEVMWRATRSRPDDNKSRSWIYQILVK